MPLSATRPEDSTAPLPAVYSRQRFLTPFRASVAAAAAAVIALATALALTVPAGAALGSADAFTVHAAAAVPVTAVDLGSPALDKAQRAAATSLATSRAAQHAAHVAHTAHLARLAALAHARAVAAAQAKAAVAQQLLAQQAAAKKQHSVVPAPVTSHQPSSGGGSSSGSGGSSGGSGCYDPSQRVMTSAQMTMLWLCAGGPSWAVGHALRIATCESGWNRFAYNPSGATGLWQILGSVVPGNLYDAHVNALNAVSKFRASGDTFAQWVCQ